MKKGLLLVVIISTMLACLACAKKPLMARVEYGSDGSGSIVAPINQVAPIITSLSDLPSDCLAEAQALIASSSPNAATEIDCSTGRFHLQARGTRARVVTGNANTLNANVRSESKLLQGFLANGFLPNKKVDFTLTVSINEASGVQTSYQNISIRPQEQIPLFLKPGDYTVQYRFVKSNWQPLPVTLDVQDFKIIIEP